MIVQIIYLEDYDWLIKVYYAVTTYYRDEILDELDSIGCDKESYEKIEDMIDNFKLNTGATYTDPGKHITFIIIGLTDSVEQFVNTYDHEKGHAVSHIAEYYEMSPYGEQYQYLSGKLGEEMFCVAKQFMCEHCRQKFIINFINKGKMKVKIKQREDE